MHLVTFIKLFYILCCTSVVGIWLSWVVQKFTQIYSGKQYVSTVDSHYCMRIWQSQNNWNTAETSQCSGNKKISNENRIECTRKKCRKKHDSPHGILINRKNIISRLKVFMTLVSDLYWKIPHSPNECSNSRKRENIQVSTEIGKFSIWRRKIFAFFQNVIECSCNSLDSVAFPSSWVERSLSKFRRTMTVSSLFGPMIFNWNCLIHIGASENYRKSLGSRLKRKISLIAFSSFEITWSAFVAEWELNKCKQLRNLRASTIEELLCSIQIVLGIIIAWRRRFLLLGRLKNGKFPNFSHRAAPCRVQVMWYDGSCSLADLFTAINANEIFFLFADNSNDFRAHQIHTWIHSASNESSGMATSQKTEKLM